MRVFQSANYRENHTRSIKTSRLFEGGTLRGRTLVEASPKGVVIDFSVASAHGWVHSQIFDAETLISEVIHRMQKRGIKFNAEIDRVQILQSEISDYIDKFCQPPSLSADDLIHNAQQTCNALRL